jgi:hypothetical protein
VEVVLRANRASRNVARGQHAGHGPSTATEVAAEVTVAEVAIEITTPRQLATRCNIHRYETTTTGCGRGALTFKTTASSK